MTESPMPVLSPGRYSNFLELEEVDVSLVSVLPTASRDRVLKEWI